jgi:prepilin-type N-terminal cleavage/methylation domain-containing protein
LKLNNQWIDKGMGLTMRFLNTLKTRKYAWASRSKGFTLIELALVIVVVAVLATVAVVNFGRMNETAEVTVAQTAQAQMEQTIAQAAMRMDVSPRQIMTNAQPMPQTAVAGLPNTTREAVVTLVQRSLATDPGTIQLTCAGDGISCQLNFRRSRRIVNYTVNNNGSLAVASIAGPWQEYQLTNGALVKK